jgi:hypothetical protein
MSHSSKTGVCSCGSPVAPQEAAAYRGRCEDCYVNLIGKSVGGLLPGTNRYSHFFGIGTGGGRRAYAQQTKMEMVVS